jgi:hypothetical protein
MRDQPSTKTRSGPGETATPAITYIAVIALVLLAVIAALTWSSRSVRVKPASGSAHAMSLAATPPANDATAGR